MKGLSCPNSKKNPGAELGYVKIVAFCPCGGSINYGASFNNMTDHIAFDDYKEAKFCTHCGKQFAVHVIIGPVEEGV